MVSIPFDIGTRQFSSKKEAIAHFRAMLARYEDGAPVGDLDAADLRGLLEHHTEREDKISAGIDHFVVDVNKEYEQTTRSFWIVRPGGLMEDFSFYHCITPKKS